MRHVSDRERRARIALRRALAPAGQVESAETATRAMTALHATEPASVYLSCWARVPYLGPHRSQIFDSRGNAGTTVWVVGRVVGCWVQDQAGVVQLRLLEPVTRPVQRRLEAEAARLSAWLAGVRIGAVYKSPAMKL